MAEIISTELHALAKLSRIALTDEQMKSLGKQIGDVLNYAVRVKELAQKGTDQATSHPTTNRVRVDEIIPTAAAPILAQAPAQVESFFVVPAIIEQ